MNGYSQAIQNGLLTPNEIREVENRPAKPNGDDLMIQGATVSLSSAIKGSASASQSPEGSATKQDMQPMQAGEAAK